jgi:hypothetical protein
MPGEVKLVDLIDGNVYKIPEGMCERFGGDRMKLHNLPIRDYPLLLTFGEFYKD